jgi:hypothetical protein
MSFVVIDKSSTRDPEERLVREAAVARGWDVMDVPLKHLQRGRFDSAGAGLIVGSVPFLSAALNQRKLTLPEDECYPECLRGYLSRTLRQATVGQAKSALEDLRGPVFIKPATRTKRFTGFVLTDPFDTRLSGVPAREPIWWSEVVQWQSEWRCYVIDGEIVHVSHCDGEPSARPSIAEATAWVNEYTLHGAPSAYALDIGMLAGGETALVEVNDGFSLGAYEGLEAEVYFDLLLSRWRGLTLAPTEALRQSAASPRR